MMYQEKLAVAIKHNGQILRENKDLVRLPYGSEFSVLVKNLNSRRVKFSLHIDGQDVLDGSEIIVNANSETEIKRYIRNGNMNEGNAFKFIERTQSIEDGPRGIKIEDGLVKVQFWFEQEAPQIKTVYHREVWWDEHYPYRRSYWNTSPFIGSISGSTGDASNVKLQSSIAKGASLSGDAMSQSASASYSSDSAIRSVNRSDNSLSNAEVSINDAGITVPGSKVEQKFNAVYGFNPETQSHVIVIRLVGRVGAINIAEPITVKTKNICSTCSHTNKHSSKFCSQCGTSLELV